MAVDFASEGDFYIRFKHTKKPLGEPSDDGRVIFFYDRSDDFVAVEVLNLRELA